MNNYKHNEQGWIVEVLSETLTHVYIKYLNSGYRTNVSNSYFKENYSIYPKINIY